MCGTVSYLPQHTVHAVAPWIGCGSLNCMPSFASNLTYQKERKGYYLATYRMMHGSYLRLHYVLHLHRSALPFCIPSMASSRSYLERGPCHLRFPFCSRTFFHAVVIPTLWRFCALPAFMLACLVLCVSTFLQERILPTMLLYVYFYMEPSFSPLVPLFSSPTLVTDTVPDVLLWSCAVGGTS